MLSTAGTFSAISALFGGPVAAAMLLLEAGVGMGASLIPILIPGLVAASIGYLIFLGIGDWGGLEATTLSVPGLPAYDGVHLRDLVVAVAVGVLLALLTEVVRRLAAQVAGPGRARLGMPLTLLLGALAIGVVALLADGLGASSQDVLFSGQASIPGLVGEDSARIVIVLLAAKALAYAICLGCGFRGGPVFPAIFLGVAVAMLAVDCVRHVADARARGRNGGRDDRDDPAHPGLAHHRSAPRRHGGRRGDPRGRTGGRRRLADDGRDRHALSRPSARVVPTLCPVVTVDQVRSVASTLPRSYEAFVQGRVKFRVGRIVYLAFSRDETLLGFAFPKEWRDALVETEPEKFMLPRDSDLRYNWAVVRLAAIDEVELRELVVDAWAMVVPKSVAAAYAESE